MLTTEYITAAERGEDGMTDEREAPRKVRPAQKKEIGLEAFVFIIVFVGFFGVFAWKMGMVNAMNTLMNTAYRLLIDTVFYLTAVCVLMGAVSALLSEFGVVSLTNRIGKAGAPQDLPVVCRVGLGEADVLVSGDQLEILRPQPRPADTHFCGHSGEDGVGGQNDPHTGAVQHGYDLRGLRREAAQLPGKLKLIGVKRFEQGLVLQRLRPQHPGEILPERLLVGAGAVVFHHGARAVPDGPDQLLRSVAVGRQLFHQKLEISVGKRILIHGQQRPVQIKENRLQIASHRPRSFHMVSLSYRGFLLWARRI